MLKNAGRDSSLKFQWNADFTDFLKNQIPNWSEIKPGEKNSNIFSLWKKNLLEATPEPFSSFSLKNSTLALLVLTCHKHLIIKVLPYLSLKMRFEFENS